MAPDRQKLIRNAERLVGRGKLNAAIEEYLKVIDTHPDDTSTLNRVGDLYARLQRIGEAIELFRQAAEHFTDEGFFVKAIAIYKKILRLDSTQLEAAESLAGLQARQGLVSDARREYLEVAKGYENRGDRASVIAVHRKLVDLEPDDPGHRLHLAELLKTEGKISQAMDQYGAIAELMLSHGKVGEAVRVCREAFELDHSNLGFVSNAVGELQRSGHDAEAGAFFEFALERNPDVRRTRLDAHRPSFEPEEEIAVELEEMAAELVEGVAAEAPMTAAEAELDEAVYELVIEDEETVEPATEIEFEIELGGIEVAAAEAEAVTVEPEDEISPVAVERVTEEDEAQAERLKELLIEADVLVRYGLEDKALLKYGEILDIVPRHFDAHLNLIHLNLAARDLARVAELAEVVLGLSKEQDRDDDWRSLKAHLADLGFEFDKSKVTAPEPEPAVAEVAVEGAVGEEASQESLSWLDELPATATAAPTATEEVFESESEFFDLASELERELEEEEATLDEELVVAPEEQSLEEIVEGFRRGMAETLSAEDYDTHYNLGIAYREMGLIDEAISEFQLAAKDSRYLVDCCSLLAACFVEKGFPELAIKWYNEGLRSPIITEDETLGLVYELGDLYLSMGETEEARSRFVEIYGVNSDYRDVGSKLAELDRA